MNTLKNILLLVVSGIITLWLMDIGLYGQKSYKKKRMETEQSYLKRKMIWFLKSDIICVIMIFVGPALIDVIWGRVWAIVSFSIFASGIWALRTRNGIDF